MNDPHTIFRLVPRADRKEYATRMRGTFAVALRDLGRAYDRFVLTLLRDLGLFRR